MVSNNHSENQHGSETYLRSACLITETTPFNRQENLLSGIGAEGCFASPPLAFGTSCTAVSDTTAEGMLGGGKRESWSGIVGPITVEGTERSIDGGELIGVVAEADLGDDVPC